MKARIPILFTKIVCALYSICLPHFILAQSVNLENGLVGKYCLDGDGIDLSPNKNHGTVLGATFVSDRFGTPGAAANFSGNQSYLQVPNKNIFNSNYTYSFWYFVTSNPPSGSARIMLGVGGSLCDQTVNISNNYFGVYTGINAGGYYNLTSTYNATDGITLPATNQWNHITAVKTNDSMKLFINGRLIASVSAPYSPCYQGNDLGAKLGGRAGHNQFFSGRMDDLFIYSRALSDTEVKALYQLNNLFSISLGPDMIMGHNDTVIIMPNDTGDRYLWNTGDTTKSLKIMQSGTYWVEVQRRCAAARDSITIELGAKVTLSADTFHCENDSLLLIPIELKGDSIIWSTGEINDSIWVKTQGTYWLESRYNGLVSRDTINVALKSVVQPILPNDTLLCPGSNILLNPGLNNGITIWYPGSTFQSTLQVNQAGKYHVEFNLDGCKLLDSINIGYILPNSPAFTSDTSKCAETPLLLGFDNSLQSPFWEDNSSDNPRQIISGGQYYLDYIYSGCPFRDTVNVRTKTKPNNFILRDTILCPGVIYSFELEGVSGQVLTWSDNLSVWNRSIKDTGTYVLELQDSGCFYADSFKLEHIPNSNYGYRLDTTLCFVTPLTLDFGSKPANTSIIWDDGSNSELKTFPTSGRYVMTVSDQCSTYQNIISIRYQDCDGIYIPNAFTPNNDGTNDSFQIHMLEPVRFKLIIFDRWGEILFSSTTYNEAWDGKFKGAAVFDGIYYYLCEVLTASGNSFSQKGFIIISR